MMFLSEKKPSCISSIVMYLGEVKGIYYVIAVKALSLFRMTLYKPSP